MELIRSKKINLSFNMAPLLDVVFLLLIFFMLSSSFSSPALRMDLPKAVTQDQKDPEQIVISIDGQGALFVNRALTSFEELKFVLELKLAMSKKKTVHLRGDRDMPYRYFIEVMDVMRQAGAEHINILHQPSERAVSTTA
jgi:biopolymer transport protein ExbD